MVMYLLLFANAFVLSAIAAYYSVYGLIAIFSAAVIPVAVMGSSLELAKLVVASWLYRYWPNIPVLMRTYFTLALGVLMLITSMGIFGYLSKAHLDQNVPMGDVQAKVSILDEKIKTSKENIDADRKALRQLDEAVDQVMARSQDEKGADKAVALRRSQAKERSRLLQDIEAEQKRIAKLNEERAPIAAEVRKVEAEVGPIKYIAALIYGDNPDSNTLEKAVRWLIIVLIFVFDPLAVLMLIAANLTQMQTAKKINNNPAPEPTKEKLPDPEPKKEEVHLEWTEQGKTEPVQEIVEPQEVAPIVTEVVESKPDLDPPRFEHPVGWMYSHEPLSAEQPKEPEQEEKPKKRTKRKAEEQKPEDTYKEDKNVSMDFNSEVEKMIEAGDNDGLEAVYKKIVKELGKKNRAKTTHWGPLRNSK